LGVKKKYKNQQRKILKSTRGNLKKKSTQIKNIKIGRGPKNKSYTKHTERNFEEKNPPFRTHSLAASNTTNTPTLEEAH
jgi:hypothetical protein